MSKQDYKRALLLSVCLALAACNPEENYCKRNYMPVVCEEITILDKEVFEMCLSSLADMRSGNNYTTNDDEDLDEAIQACERASTPYYYHQKECKPNPEYVAQQEFCTIKPIAAQLCKEETRNEK